MSKGETEKRRILRGRRDIDGTAVCMNEKRKKNDEVKGRLRASKLL